MNSADDDGIVVWTMTFDEWAEQVDLLCRAELACSWADLCGDREPLESGFDVGQTPREFVHWFAEKYDLHWVDDPFVTSRRSR